MDSDTQNWKPSKNPDPQVILNQTLDDVRAKRYKMALAKHVWFYENALRIQPGMFGVRLSFALSYWKQLGEEYPPAIAKLRSIQDRLEKKAILEKNLAASNTIPDLAAINRTLGEDARTVHVFKKIDKGNAESAKYAFIFVKSALLKSKEYALYGKYVNAQDDFSQIKQHYELDQRLAKDPRFGKDHAEFAKSTFQHDCVTLIAILAVNNRKPESIVIAKRVKDEMGKEINDASFQQAITSALAGIVPPPRF
jgi:hypothetical protein